MRDAVNWFLAIGGLGACFAVARFVLGWLRRQRRANRLILELLEELMALRLTVTRWWAGELGPSWFERQTGANLVHHLRTPVLDTTRPSEFEELIGKELAAKVAVWTRRLRDLRERGAHSYSGEADLDGLAGELRRLLTHRRLRSLDLRLAIPSPETRPAAAPDGPAEQQRRLFEQMPRVSGGVVARSLAEKNAHTERVAGQ